MSNGRLAHSHLSRLQFCNLSLTTEKIEKLYCTIVEWLQCHDREPKSLGFINPHVFNHCKVSKQLRDFIENCDLVCIDGVGISLTSRITESTHLPRVVATHLFDRVLASREFTATAILIGASANEVLNAQKMINRISPSLNIISAIDGFRTFAEYSTLLRNYPDVDMLLVGMGTPRSEYFLSHTKSLLSHALCWHIGGGTIKLYAGTKHQAPNWLSRSGLEWLHRLILEPETRNRYTKGSLTFLRNIIHEAMKEKP